MSEVQASAPSTESVEGVESVASAAAEALTPSIESPNKESTISETQADNLEKKAESGEKLTKKEERQLKEYRLKVNGREEVIKFDPFNDDEVVKHLQKSKASDLKFKEAAEVRQAAMEFIEQLRKNPRKVLSDPNIGVDVRKFAEEILNEEIAELEKSPEQREREKLQRELEELKAQAKEREEAAKRAEFERMQVEQERILESEISSALDIGGIPKTPRTVKAMAEMAMIALENNIDLSMKDLVPIVKNTTMGEFKEIINSLGDDQLEDFLGKEVIGRLRKRNVAKAKTVASANAVKPTGATPKAEESKKNEKLTYKKFFGL